jgi:5-methylcytosine-specific restriction endonuclease McrA
MKKLEGRDFNREKVRIRDNHTCQKCFKIGSFKFTGIDYGGVFI